MHVSTMRHTMTFWKTISDGVRGDDEVARRIQRSIDFMLAHLNRPLQVAELAAQASFSSSHYFTLFKRSIGGPPLDYFTRLRMRRACDLLDVSDLSVKEVAGQMGYGDPFYFSRVFKATCGVAPSDYRVLPETERQDIRQCGLDEETGYAVRAPLCSAVSPVNRLAPMRQLVGANVS